tara:strand:- start:4804 stop:5124 length:321 start_codon:yes stop_codon:yes gene_type:complete
MAEHENVKNRVMTELRETAIGLGVDLSLSSNDRFQQLLNVPGEPLYVSMSGGAYDNRHEHVPLRNEKTPSQNLNQSLSACKLMKNLVVELRNMEGEISFKASRMKQ